MDRFDPSSREAEPDQESLAHQIHVLQERLAFYEGFDRLIQENVAHARELFRLAAQEREAAAAAIVQTRLDAGRREAQFRGELEQIASDLSQVSRMVETLSSRVSRALGEPALQNDGTEPASGDDPRGEQAVAVVVHGVPSAGTALSLQRFVASLPQVADVSAREFVGGVLRLDARARDSLGAAQFLAWSDANSIEPLTERADVLELVLRERK